MILNLLLQQKRFFLLKTLSQETLGIIGNKTHKMTGNVEKTEEPSTIFQQKLTGDRTTHGLDYVIHSIFLRLKMFK